MNKITPQESGRSMIEMLGVLAIIGVLSVGGIAGYSQAMSKFKVTKTTDQIQTMVTNIRTLFASQKNYKSVDSNGSSQLLYSVGILTDENCPGGGDSCASPVNPYGKAGSIVLAPTNYKNATNKAFYVAYSGLPADACVRLATQSWGDASSGLIGLRAGKGNVESDLPESTAANENNSTIATATSVQMELADAATGCGSSGDESYIVLFYK